MKTTINIQLTIAELLTLERANNVCSRAMDLDKITSKSTTMRDDEDILTNDTPITIMVVSDPNMHPPYRAYSSPYDGVGFSTNGDYILAHGDSVNARLVKAIINQLLL